MKNDTEKSIKKFICDLLERIGFNGMDITPDGQYIYRKDNIDIIIEVIKHKDNL